MYLEVFSDNPFDTNCWLIAAEGSDEAIVVDPGFEPDRVHALLGAAGKRPVAVLATHGHYDHIGSAGLFCGDDVPFYIHEADELALSDSRSWGAGFPTPPIEIKDVRTLTDGDVLELGGFHLEVMHTPGHTPGSVCFRSGDWVLSGDLVFRGAIGRYDFPNSSAPDMERSLRRFLELPDGLSAYPGHGPDTTVELERRTNPFLLDLA
jgi:glyoxylase-like metal-dependent hydrolase (beta-lactamase superfamily II)